MAQHTSAGTPWGATRAQRWATSAMKRVGTTIAHWSGTDKGSGATPASNAQGMPASITT
ncbi:MAG: hypothetical protein RL430_1349, partial [Actinomycetota bacterium]